MRTIVNPRKYFLKKTEEKNNLNGRNVKVLLLDSGIGDDVGIKGGHNNLMAMQGYQPCSLTCDDHGLRVASIIGERATRKDRYCSKHEAVGIASGVSLLSAVYNAVYPFEISQFVIDMAKQYGVIDIVCHPYSGVENLEIKTKGRASFINTHESNELVNPLNICAVGHDGPNKIRFPASCENTLSVGVFNHKTRSLGSMGTDLEWRKPEIVVPDYAYSCRVSGGRLGELTGSSAACAVVSGLAALVVHKLKLSTTNINSAKIKAVLLALSSRRNSISYNHRCIDQGSINLLSRNVCAVTLERAYGATCYLQCRVTDDELVSIAVVPVLGRRTPYWHQSAPNISVVASQGTKQWKASDRAWLVSRIYDAKNSTMIVEIKLHKSWTHFAIAIMGADRILVASGCEVR